MTPLLPYHIPANEEYESQVLPSNSPVSTYANENIHDVLPPQNVINLNLEEIEERICAKISNEISALKGHIDKQFTHLYSHLSAKIEKMMDTRVSCTAATIAANNYEIKPVSNQQEAIELEKNLESASFRLEMVRIIIIKFH